jgi:hypothetical protein
MFGYNYSAQVVGFVIQGGQNAGPQRLQPNYPLLFTFNTSNYGAFPLFIFLITKQVDLSAA